MDKNRKKKLLTASTYIIASFCLVSFIAMGIFASLRAAFTVPENSEYVPPQSIVKQEEPKTIVPQPPLNSEVFEPKQIPEAPIEPSVNEQASSPKISYMLPVEGEAVKDFSGDMLVFSQTMCDYRVHNGTDFECEYGQAVKSFSDGIVEAFYEDPLNGMTLVVKHNDELTTCYSNLAPELPEGIEVGTAVRTGDIIGFVGEPGILECAENCHLHFEIKRNGKNVGLTDFSFE